MTIPAVLYEMEPIGKDGALEAVAVHWYCSPECRNRETGLYGHLEAGENGDYADGTVCETCSKPLERKGEV